MDCPLGQKEVAVVERWPSLEVQLQSIFLVYGQRNHSETQQ